MENRKGKIGINTAIIIFLTSSYSPTVSIFGTYTAKAAKQAAWLSPFVACIVFVYLILKLNTLLVDHPGLSLIKIYEKITGKILAKIIAFIYLIWIIILLGVNAKAYTIRLTSVLYPNIQENLFLVITFFIIATLFIKSGIVVSARMFTVFFWIILFGFTILSSVLLPNISLDNLTPISYLDIIPTMNASIGILYTWSYITMFFIMSDDMIGFKDFKKRGLQTVAFLFCTITILIVSVIGTHGSYLISQASFPYLIAVEQIKLLNAITGIEAILIILWILSDFAIVTMLIFTCLKLMKYLFNIEDTSLYSNIFMIMLFFITNLIADNFYQFYDVVYKFIYPANIILFTVIPILMAWIYKLRKKASKALSASRKI